MRYMIRALVATVVMADVAWPAVVQAQVEATASGRIPCSPRDGYRNPVTGGRLPLCPPGQITTQDDIISARREMERYERDLNEARRNRTLDPDILREAEKVDRAARVVLERAERAPEGS